MATHTPMPTLTPTTLITRVSNLHAADMDEEIVLVNIERGMYYGLEKSARLIWNILEESIQFNELCNRLAACYNVSPVMIEADVRPFIEDMANSGIIILL